MNPSYESLREGTVKEPDIQIHIILGKIKSRKIFA